MATGRHVAALGDEVGDRGGRGRTSSVSPSTSTVTGRARCRVTVSPSPSRSGARPPRHARRDRVAGLLERGAHVGLEGHELDGRAVHLEGVYWVRWSTAATPPTTGW